MCYVFSAFVRQNVTRILSEKHYYDRTLFSLRTHNNIEWNSDERNYVVHGALSLVALALWYCIRRAYSRETRDTTALSPSFA